MSLQQVIGIAQEEVLNLKQSIASAYGARCSITRNECANLQYDACQTDLTRRTECIQNFELSTCGEYACDQKVDLSTSVVRIPESVATGVDFNPTDSAAIEAVCYSSLAEADMEDLYDAHHFTTGVQSAYFGSETGIFRFYPGISQQGCGWYDPRTRPWYVAAATGPKDVVIVLDTSGSMNNFSSQGQTRLDLAKSAAVSVLNSLAMNNYVSVVVFGQSAWRIMNDTVVQATQENIDALSEQIMGLSGDGATNFVAAFTEAFDIIDQSRAAQVGSGCSTTAILMLTDGTDTVTSTSDIAQTVTELVNSRNVGIDANLFTYSLGADADQTTTKMIACRTGGVWQHISDGGNLQESMEGYYKYYAAGMFQQSNRTVWVEPYLFSSGDVLGTTCSTPVYDETMSPPLFLGVVGVDFTLDSLLEMSASYTEVLDELILESSFCPSFQLTGCEKQAFRNSVSPESVCPNPVCELPYPSFSPEACILPGEVPENLWVNTNLDTHLDRDAFIPGEWEETTCCMKEVYDSDYNFLDVTCSAMWMENGQPSLDGTTIAIIAAGVSVGAVVLLLVGIGFCCGCFAQSLAKKRPGQNSPPPTQQQTPVGNVLSHSPARVWDVASPPASPQQHSFGSPIQPARVWSTSSSPASGHQNHHSSPIQPARVWSTTSSPVSSSVHPEPIVQGRPISYAAPSAPPLAHAVLYDDAPPSYSSLFASGGKS
jgi:Mg-chelatase subunit ChlD